MAGSKCIEHSQNGFGMGYANGQYIDSEGKRRTGGLHRITYCLHNKVTMQGIKGKVVRHTCDNARCVNPAHLLLGSQQDNVDDMKSRGRDPVGERHGSFKLTDKQVRDIHSLYWGGGYTQSGLAKIYGVSQAQVNNIVNRRQRA